MFKFHELFYLLPKAVARSSSDGWSTICYVFPGLLTTSFFHITELMGQNQRRRACFIEFTT